jgi:hypothetical protein
LPASGKEKSMAARLIFNADDYGRSDAENLVIAQTLQAGLVRSTTVMANMPAAAAIRDVQTSMPSVGIGVHLNLTEGRPVLKPGVIPSIVNRDGFFLSKAELFARCSLGLVSRTDVEAELRAQVDRVMEWTGPVSHADSHQNVIVLPCILPAIISLLHSLGVNRVRTERVFDAGGLTQATAGNGESRQASSRWLRGSLWAWIKEYRGTQLCDSGLRGTEYLLLGAPGYKDDATPRHGILRWWERVLPQLPDSSFEVPTHPGFSPGEAGVLADTSMIELVRRSGIVVASFADIDKAET